MKDYEAMEVKIVKEWQGDAKRNLLLRQIKRRFKAVPADVEKALKACGDLARLDAIGEAFAGATTIEEFRQEAGL